MDIREIISIGGQAITFIGVIFVVYHYFRNPQIKSDKTDALLNERFKTLETAFNNLRDNHIHTLDTKIDANRDAIAGLAREVTKLSTIIEERIPRRVN